MFPDLFLDAALPYEPELAPGLPFASVLLIAVAALVAAAVIVVFVIAGRKKPRSEEKKPEAPSDGSGKDGGEEPH